MTLKMAFSDEVGVVTVMDADPKKFVDGSVMAFMAQNDAAVAKSDEDRKWALRKEPLACSADMSLADLEAIQAQSGLSWPVLELVIATLQIKRYRATYGG